MEDLVDWVVGLKDWRTKPRVENGVNSPILHPYPSCRQFARDGENIHEIPSIWLEFFILLSYDNFVITIRILNGDNMTRPDIKITNDLIETENPRLMIFANIFTLEGR